MLLDPIVFPVVIAIVAIIFLAIFFHFVPFFLWLSAKVSGVRISLIQLFLMRIRNVPPGVIVPSLIEAHKAGLKNITRDNLEAHYMTGGLCNAWYMPWFRHRKPTSTCLLKRPRP